MKKLKTVFNFEFKELIFRKSLMISTLVMSLVFFAITFAPRIINLFTNDEDTTETGGSETPVDSALGNVVIGAENEELLDYAKGIFVSYEDIEYQLDVNKIKEDVNNEVYETGYVFTGSESYTVVKKDTDMGFDDQLFNHIVTTHIKESRLLDKGIDPLDVLAAEDVNLNVEYETLGRDASQGFIVGFVALFTLYMLILLFGQLVATSVAREKDSRAMELLITSTDPKTLILGKVFATGLVGVVQVLIIFGAIALGYFINSTTYPAILVDMISASTSWDIIAIYALFSFTGYLLYLFIYAALGSLVSKVEDVGSAVSSVTIVFIIAYFVATTAMTAPDLIIVRISSYIPFISLFTTPIRYMLTTVSALEIVISISLMIAVTAGVAYLSVYIYRKGSLNYGNKMSLLKMFKKQ